MGIQSFKASGVTTYDRFKSARTAAAIPPLQIQYVVVAGGGSGSRGGGNSEPGQGGGAGGYRSSVIGELIDNFNEPVFAALLNTNYQVTVGAGASAASGVTGNRGSNSVFASITSSGGGGGGIISHIGGSSGGGWSFQTTSYEYNPATNGQGNVGGRSEGSGSLPRYGAGGGGAGARGGSTNHNEGIVGAGGSGVQTFITGSGVFLAGGGGGRGTNGSSGAGGNGGGGAGGTNDGAVNTGGGGGGNVNAGTTGAGGSGVVILRYPSNYTITVGAGLTASHTNQAVGTNERYTRITAGSGNVSWSG